MHDMQHYGGAIPSPPKKKNSDSRLPDFGFLKIEDWNEFLKESQIYFNIHWNRYFSHTETLNDFYQLKLLGSGSYGSVVLIKHKERNNYFAMKMIEKKKIIRTRQLDHVKTEKLVLQSINFPMTVYLKYFFQDNSYIYMVMPFIPGGDLFNYLRKVRRFEESQAKFYVSQVILALEYLHFLDLLYRDLKPENILIDHTGYLKLGDFGFCKRLMKPRTYTMCGTPEYLAPEVILSKGYAKSVDWWTVGILTYELVAGYPPFHASESMKLYDKIISLSYKIPTSFSSDLKDLVKNILQVDLTRRFGNMKNGVNDIKEHKWFRTINWMMILNRKASAKYRPKFEQPGDTENFNTMGWTPPKISKEDHYTDEFSSF